MGARNGHQHSVRVEVESGSDAPDVAAASSGGGKQWVLVLAVVAVIGVAAAVVMVRPSGDEAADGSERVMPTTTTTTMPAEAPESLSLGGATSPTISVDQIDFRHLPEIIEANVGFLALGILQSDRPLPPILRSVDGTNWFAVETTISGDSVIDDIEPGAQLFWSGLTRDDDGFSVVVDLDRGPGQPQQTAVFRSLQSGNWTQAAESTSPGPTDLFERRGLVEGFAVHSETLGDLGLAEVIANHTSLDLGDAPVCGAFPSPTNEISIQTCENETQMITTANVVSSAPPDQVLNCISFLGERSVRTRRSVRVGLATGVVEPFEDSETSFDFLTASPLGDGLLASIDVGDTSGGSSAFVDSLGDGNALCDGLADTELSTVPTMLILDVGNLGVQRVQMPDAFDVVASAFATRVLGELKSHDGALSRVMVGVESDLWALDLESETWIEVVNGPPIEANDFSQGYYLSASGRRAYRIEVAPQTNEPIGLEVVDLTLQTSGSITATEQVFDLELDPETMLTPFGRVTFATDTAVFYNDFFSDANMLFTIPEVNE